MYCARRNCLYSQIAAGAPRMGLRKIFRTVTTQFGYQKVDESEKEAKVKTVFANVASKYDLMNDTMSFGVHRLWKSYFVERQKIRRNTRVVDVAGGTGDIAFRILQRLQKIPSSRGSVTVVDVNEAMLEVGKLRAIDNKWLDKNRLEWVCANAEELPFDDGSFDLYTIAFGIRNCTHIDRVLSEAFRVLRPNGVFSCLEFSHVKNPVLRSLYDHYSFQVIPVMGQLVAADYKSYKYLVESIRVFPKQTHFAGMIRAAGFGNVTYENLTNGICAIHSGVKPQYL